MSVPTRPKGYRIAAALIAVVGLAAASAAISESWTRLRGMPLERRRDLAEALDRFDQLPADERRTIREIDARLAELAPERRAHALSVLRRYHLWLQGLPEEQRARVLGSDPSDRYAVVADLRARPPEAEQRLPLLGISPSDAVGGSAHALADRVRAWLSLPPAEQARLGTISPRAKRIERLDQLRVEMDLGSVRRPLPVEADAEEGLPELSLGRELPLRRFAGKEATRVGERVRERLGDALVMARTPAPDVPPSRLARFDAALPGWLREPLDALPPDAARRRLAILYRLVYPEGSDMPDSKPAPKAGNAAPPSSSGPQTSPGTPF